MKHLDHPYITWILDIIRDIEESINGLSARKFKENKDVREANVRRVEIIGEAVKNISEEFKNKHPQVKWESFEKAKKMIAHHYFGVDIDTIWNLLKKEIPNLKNEIRLILEKEKE